MTRAPRSPETSIGSDTIVTASTASAMADRADRW